MNKFLICICRLTLIYLLCTSHTLPQSADRLNIIPEGLGFSNHLEYSYNDNLETEVLENWLNLDYRFGDFGAGLRFDIFQPNDPDPSISRGKEKFAGIDIIYFSISTGNPLEGLDLMVGNYYTLLGRGMIINSYEDRSIRIDNDLLGLKVTGKYSGFRLTALSGSPANSKNERNDILHLVDLEYRKIRWLKLGGTFATNLPPIEGLANTNMASIRLLPSIWNIDIYTEYGVKTNSDIQENVFNNSESIIGRGFYGNLNIYFGPLSLLGEYKYYDNYAFTTEDGTVNYNQPPSVRIEYAYILPNRHPSPLNPNNEQGFQIAAGYNIDETFFSAAYTLTQTLPEDSYFQRITNTKLGILTQLKEFYFQGERDWGSGLTTVAAFAYNEELATNTKNIAPIVDLRYFFEEVNTIKLVFEHQNSTNRTTHEQYYNDVLLLEYLRSPNLSVALVAEMEIREPEKGKIKREFWGLVQIGYNIDYHTNLFVLVGTRQAGNICIGGVCRFEPELRGVEIKMITRL